MRILQIYNRYLERGGEEIFVEQATKDLSQRHQVRDLHFSSAEWSGEGKFSRLSQPLRMFRNPRALRIIREAIEEFRPEVALLHNVFPVGSLASYRLLESMGVPAIQYAHNFRPFSVNGYCWAGGRVESAGLRRNFLPEILRGSWQNSRVKTGCYAAVLWAGHLCGIWRGITHWIAISEFMRQTLIQGGISPERITTILHRGELDPALPSAPPNRTLLFLGRLTEEKGVRVLADAWKQVESRRNSGRLIIGGTGPLMEELRHTLSGCTRVQLAGFLGNEAKQEVIRSASALVVPSVWWEPFGLVVCEAYNHGKPVLASASGGLPEIVKDGITGWLHTPGDSAALASQIVEMFDDEEESRRRGEAGRRWLEENAGISDWLDRVDSALIKAKNVFDQRRLD